MQSSSLFDEDSGLRNLAGRATERQHWAWRAGVRGCGQQWPPWSTLVPSARRRETDRDARSQ